MSAKKYMSYDEAALLNDIVCFNQPIPNEAKMLSMRDILGPNDNPPAHKSWTPPPPKIVTYNEARQILFDIYCEKLKGRKPEFTDKQAKIIGNVLRYIIQDDSSEYDLSKGLFIFGDFGRGKSLLLKCLLTFCESAKREKISNVNPYDFYEYEDLINDAKDQGTTSFIRRLGSTIAIDDLGYQGQSQISIYGTKEDFVTSIVKVRHSAFMKRGYKTYFTSNLTPEELKKNHSEGTSSRMEEMANLIYWSGENLRK